MKKILLTIFGLSLLTSCGEIIDSGHRGVKKHFGKVEQESLSEGFYFYFPFTTSISEVDTRVKKVTFNTMVYTKDIQQARIEYTINAGLDSTKVHLLYAEYGVRGDGVESKDLQQKVLVPIISAAIKTVFGKWEATEVVANRQAVTQGIFDLIKEKLAARYISLSNFEITNIDYADKFEQAVEEKVVAIQRAEEAKNNTVRIKEEADQKIISAKAEAESIRIRARALSANKGLVEYEAINAQKEAIAKWNGDLPNQMLGGVVPFIDINR